VRDGFAWDLDSCRGGVGTPSHVASTGRSGARLRYFTCAVTVRLLRPRCSLGVHTALGRFHIMAGGKGT